MAASPASSPQHDALSHPTRHGPLRRLALGVALAGLLCGLAWGMGQGATRAAPPTNALLQEEPTPTLEPNTGAIAGSAWQDQNGNGLREGNEPPLAGTLLTLYRQSGPALTAVTSDQNGRYRLAGLESGLYRLEATAPGGYRLTTDASLNLFVSVGTVLTIDFGAQFIPTPTPTATPLPQLDTVNAARGWCGSVIFGDTRGGTNYVDSYACRPYWVETGPELVYRVELNRSQLLTASFITTTADLDLFLLRTSYPTSCVVGGDNYLTHLASPGLYYLVVDGYADAAGSFALKLTCPLEVQATATLTPTPPPTRTPTITPTPSRTATPTLTPIPKQHYLPLALRLWRSPTVLTTLVLQQDHEGYAGMVDTTLSAWQPEVNLSLSERLSLRYNQQTSETTHMAPLLRFDMAFLPPRTQIAQATLHLYATWIERPEDLIAEVHGLLAPWDEATVTWRQRAAGSPWNAPGAQGAGRDHMPWAADAQRISAVDRWYTFDVTDLVAQWVVQPANNNGVIILAQPGTSEANLQMDFASGEIADSDLRPKLTILSYLSSAAGE